MQLLITMEEHTKGNSKLNLSISELLIDNPPCDIFSIGHQWDSSWPILTALFVFVSPLRHWCHCTLYHSQVTILLRTFGNKIKTVNS